MGLTLNAAEAVLGPALDAGHGDDPALIAGKRVITYAELARMTNRAGNALLALGIDRGDRVLLLMRDTPAFAAAYLGALRIGAIAVALNTRSSPEALSHVLADSAARLLLIDAALLPILEQVPAAERAGIVLAVAGGVAAGMAGWDVAEASASERLAAAATSASEPAFWIYSSGTTGPPKAIVHAHKDVLPTGLVLTEVLGLGRGTRVLTTSKLFFAYALDNAFLGALRAGTTTILQPDWPEPAATIEVAARAGAEVLFSVPSFYRRLLAEPVEQLARLGAVRHFISGGETIPEAFERRWRAATGRPILQIYGTSETFCVSMATRPEEATSGSVGRPLPGVGARLLDESGAEVAPGGTGVLWIAHPALAQGYWRRPALTGSTFRAGWFNSHDCFSVGDDGLWYHRGRDDEMLKIAGQWVGPGEVEAVLLAVAGVADAACVPVPDADGFPRLAGFVVTAAPAEKIEAAVAAACAEQLARHQRPRWIRCVAALPRTATGKVQRFRLREQILRELSAAAAQR
ncbi:MAG TPA: AMP-binding protein [Stellaceae bacterium]|nr:AMP-binding protein [Stellaceae bacterium]